LEGIEVKGLQLIQTVEDFDEATLFERLALDRVRPVLGDESTDEMRPALT